MVELLTDNNIGVTTKGLNQAKKKKFEKLGKHFKMKIKCIMSETKEPIGNGVGPILEMIDVIKVLRRESKSFQLEEKSLEISAEYAWKIKEQLRTEQYERDLMNLRENYITPTKFHRNNIMTSDDRML
jgi:thymidine phosphorylase